MPAKKKRPPLKRSVIRKAVERVAARREAAGQRYQPHGPNMEWRISVYIEGINAQFDYLSEEKKDEIVALVRKAMLAGYDSGFDHGNKDK
jgi:hypothetical protein